MHALASTLKTSTQAIEAGLSAREFSDWCRWMDAERVGPRWDQVRHAELMAAVANGACQRKGGGLFSAADFLPADPWAEPERVDRESIRRQLAAMERNFW